MPEITTVVTFTLTHSRKLREPEFKNLINNITEHIHGEQDADEGHWGFKAITDVHCAATHIVDGNVVMDGPSAEWGPLWDKTAMEERIRQAIEPKSAT